MKDKKQEGRKKRTENGIKEGWKLKEVVRKERKRGEGKRTGKRKNGRKRMKMKGKMKVKE